jgi:hypothetical protein
VKKSPTKIPLLRLAILQLPLQLLNHLLIIGTCRGTRNPRLARRLLLQFRILFLSLYEVEDDVEAPRQHEGEEEREASQVDVSLGAMDRRDKRPSVWGHTTHTT